MSKPIVFMFSGQGCQFFHMGESLYQGYQPFRRWMARLDRLFHEILGASVLQHLYDGRKSKTDAFDRIQFSHPAVFMVQYALAQVLIERGVKPDFLLGASLGELIAAPVAGVVTLEDAAEMVVKQAALIDEYCRAGEGGMLAVLHEPAIYHRTPLMRHRTELAGVHHDAHFVIAGGTEALADARRFLESTNVPCQPLPVAFAFHSRWVDPAGPSYCAYLRTRPPRAPNTAVISCVTGAQLTQVPPDYFWQAVRQPILFHRALKHLEGLGNYVYVDLGPSATLANFVSRAVTSSKDLYAIAKRGGRPDTSGLPQSLYLAATTPFDTDSRRFEQIGSLLAPTTTIVAPGERKEMKAYLFPGQGSQQQGMGERLFDHFDDLTRLADQVLGYSIKQLCRENPDGRLMQTQFTQPAIYVVNALSCLLRNQSEPEPDYVLGHSVGEYNALLASGVIDFASGLKLVKMRGDLMAEANGGGMAAILGLSTAAVEETLKINRFRNLYVANYNSAYQAVISGAKEEVVAGEQAFLKAGATHYRILNVSGAFHTPYMADAKKRFARYVEEFEFKSPKMPIISNVTARPYRVDEIKANLIEQITAPVRWMESIRYLLAKGVSIANFHEISGSNVSVVKALAMRIASEAGPLDLRAESEAEVRPPEERRTASPRPPSDRRDRIDDARSPILNRGLNDKKITAESLGCEEFKRDYGLKYAYLMGGMYRGVASTEMVTRAAKAGMMGFFGTGGLSLAAIESAIKDIQKGIEDGSRFGINIVSNPLDPEAEERVLDVCLKHAVSAVEAGAYMTITPALVKYRAKGLRPDGSGRAKVLYRIIAKLSRPEVAEQFLSPAPERIVKNLLETNKITREDADLLASVAMADDICVEADSGGHTDQGKPYVLMPVMLKLRDDFMRKHAYVNKIRIGAAGGIGTPEAAAAAFILGAEFILTGSINQCSAEAGTSDAAKDVLQQINVQDTDYAPAGDMFELGAKVQVVKRGGFFPARANKLYELYKKHDSIDDIDPKTREQLEERYFKKSLQDVYREVKCSCSPHEIEKAERNPKQKMALIFRAYLAYGSQLALRGDPADRVNYQIHCGPALGAFNQWVKGTPLEDWRNRHVDEMGKKLLQETAELLTARFQQFAR